MLTKAQARKLDADSLRHVWNDCENALQAMPNNPKAGQYLDEQHTCSMELARRRRQNRNATKGRGRRHDGR